VEPVSDGWSAVAAQLSATNAAPARTWSERFRLTVRRPLAPAVAGVALCLGLLAYSYERTTVHTGVPAGFRANVVATNPQLGTRASGIEIISPSPEVTEVDDPLGPQMDSFFAAVDRATQKSSSD